MLYEIFKTTLVAGFSIYIVACDQNDAQAPVPTLDDTSKVSFSSHTESLVEYSGIKIICNGDSIGYVLNGINWTDGLNGVDSKDGLNGIDGKDGKDGENGYSPIKNLVKMVKTTRHPVLQNLAVVS